MPRERSSRRRRSSSSDSVSSYERRKSRSKHKRRSRSRNRSESRHRRKRSSSVKRRRRSYSRSVSRDRYESKHKRRSPSRSRSKRSRRSSSRSHTRSHSRSTYKKSKRRKSTSSESSKSSFDIEPANPHRNLDDTDTKVQKAIKAAESHGISLTKLPPREYKEVNVKEDMPSIQDRKLLDELNNDTFVQKSFSSSRSKKQNIVIDLNSDNVNVPEPNAKVTEENSIIDFTKLTKEEELTEMWIRKLYLFRRKMLREEN